MEVDDRYIATIKIARDRFVTFKTPVLVFIFNFKVVLRLMMFKKKVASVFWFLLLRIYNSAFTIVESFIVAFTFSNT